MPNYQENNQYITKAKAEAVQAFNASSFSNVNGKLDGSQMYVVWFSKTLKNWKALVSTDAVTGVYIEVTYDGSNAQAYVDVYAKTSNVTIPDSNLKY